MSFKRRMTNDAFRERAKKRKSELDTRAVLSEFDEVKLYEKIIDKVVGQDVLASIVASKICTSGILQDSTKPRCSLLITGMPGVGKSHFAKTVARATYDKQKEPFLLLNCGEVLDRHSFDSLMFGTAERFVGAGKSPIGMYLQKYPNGGVIIFDEIEKALHAVGKEATSVFLGIMEEGELADADKKTRYKLDKHIVIFTSNEKQEELTAVADEILPEMKVEIIDGNHGKELVIPAEADELTNRCKEALTHESCFDGAFLRRLDFVSSVKSLNEDETLILAEVLFIKYCESKEITKFDDSFEEIYVDEFLPWFGQKISSIGQAQAEKAVARSLDADLASIIKARVKAGKDRNFIAQLSEGQGGFILKDATGD